MVFGSFTPPVAARQTIRLAIEAIFEMASNAMIGAFRARRLVSLAGEGPARGRELERPIRFTDNALLVLAGERVRYAGPWRPQELPAGLPARAVRDLGDVCIMPGCVNAHTHIQLSWLAGQTSWGQGFAPWLASLIPRLAPPGDGSLELAIEQACADLARYGCAHVGDVGGSIAGALSQVSRALARQGVGATHFLESFGFRPPLARPRQIWPGRSLADLARLRRRPGARFAPAGHALYSTAPALLQRAAAWCAARGLPFTFHLAESAEEEMMLAEGAGPLRDCYRETVLPPDWRAPGMSPLDYAESLGLLRQGTLAVHGVRLDARAAARLAASGTALCLCPRSNRNLGLGLPRAREFMGARLLLCLGTDGLSSNTDLDVRQEALFLRRELDLPLAPLLRMLTVNGSAALGLRDGSGTLAPGAPGIFAILPRELEEG